MKFTVKIISMLALLTFAILFSGFYSLSYLKHTATALEDRVNVLDKGLDAEDWDSVSSSLGQIAEEWQRAKKSWAILIDHIEIDNIDETLARMTEYIKAKDSPSALAESSALKLYLRHIPAMETPSLENFF